MSTPFRNDVDALETRLLTLDEELASLRSKAREYEKLTERLEQVTREHEEVRREIDARTKRRAVPLLDTLRVATPCDESWDDMIGDAKTRFCAKCQKDVHNVSEMTRDEANAFLESVAGAACVRMYKRRDGTILTADCPVGARKQRVKRLFLATVGGGLAAGALAFWAYEETAVMGDIGPAPVVETGNLEPTSAEQGFATPPARTTSVAGTPAGEPARSQSPRTQRQADDPGGRIGF